MPKKQIVDSVKFTTAILEHTKALKEAKAKDLPPPRISEYIGKSIIDLCEGISRRPNFIGYSYRESMVEDAIENCVKVVSRGNFDPDLSDTTKPKPNAFNYFSTCAYWAMVRRIQKEQKEERKKLDLINSLAIENFITEGDYATREHVSQTLNKLRSTYSIVDDKKSKSKTKHYGFGAPKSRGRKKKKTLDEIIEE